MRIPIHLIFLAVFTASAVCGQTIETDKLSHYRIIPEHAENFSPGTVASRLTDGLGFRFYWATEGLTEKDHNFRPGPDSRSIGETISHIYDLTKIVLKSVGETNTNAEQASSIQEKRKIALLNIERISKKLLSSSPDDFEDFNVTARDGAQIPFWNMLNGPIADCIWHSGQIASYRRLSGNPINPNVSFFSGRFRTR